MQVGTRMPSFTEENPFVRYGQRDEKKMLFLDLTVDRLILEGGRREKQQWKDGWRVSAEIVCQM